MTHIFFNYKMMKPIKMSNLVLMTTIKRTKASLKMNKIIIVMNRMLKISDRSTIFLKNRINL